MLPDLMIDQLSVVFSVLIHDDAVKLFESFAADEPFFVEEDEPCFLGLFEIVVVGVYLETVEVCGFG
jgi:hypothetical protein